MAFLAHTVFIAAWPVLWGRYSETSYKCLLWGFEVYYEQLSFKWHWNIIMAHAFTKHVYTVEPPSNGHVAGECFVHYSEVVLSSEVLTCIQLLAGGTQFVHCREVVHSSECPLSEVPLYFECVPCVVHVRVCVCSNKLRTYTNPGLFTLLSFSVHREQTELNPALFCPAVSLSVTV